MTSKNMEEKQVPAQLESITSEIAHEREAPRKEDKHVESDQNKENSHDVMGDKIGTYDEKESPNKMIDRQLEVNETDNKRDVYNIKDETTLHEKETESNALPKTDTKSDLTFLDKIEMVSSEGFKIKIYLHDLLETNVDAIVNAANEKLSHGAGVAKVIAKRAGSEMTRECTDYIKKNKSLAVSKAFASGAGKLKFKKIIHVVGPAWSDYKDKEMCLNDLAKTITNLLEKAKEYKVKTVAMPTISSGIFKVPKSLCAAMYLRGAFDFSWRKTFGSLQELHIVDLCPDVLLSVQETYSQYLTTDKVIDPSWLISRHEKQDSVTQKESITDVQNSNSSKPSEKDQDMEEISGARSNNANCERNVNSVHFIKNFKNVHVFIYTQDVGSLEGIDVAVSCENPHFTGKGGIAAALLSKGGTAYTKEHDSLQKNAPYPQFSTIITPGYNTNFKTVCHAIIVAFSKTRPLSQACQMLYKNFVCSILKEMNSRSEQAVRTKKTKGFCSIVLPLLGAGTLQDQHSIQNLCTLMLEAIENFATFCPKQITEIHLVNMRDEFTQMLITNTRKMDSNRPLLKISDSNTKMSKFDSKPFKYIYNWRVLPREQLVNLKDFIKPVSEHNKGVCIICLHDMTKPVAFTKCHHCFCEECIDEYFTMKPACPVCNSVYGKLYGDQPLNGEAHIFKDKRSLPGYPRTETFIISYEFPNGEQEECHPDPGQPYIGTQR